MGAQKRLLWLDMAKGLAILLMVLGHCLSDETAAHDFIYSFHMPLFFVLAGFTMRPKPRKQVLVSSTRRLLVPYMLVCAILLFFAFVPPCSINDVLDTQKSVSEVLVEIAFGAGEQGEFYGFAYQAIGAIWFLPCLFIARIAFNEILLAGERASAHNRIAGHTLVVALVLASCAAGYVIGNYQFMPLSFDTALVAVLFMYVGYAVKRIGLERIPLAVVVLLACVWTLYPLAGSNEMATHAYVENPASLVTASAASVVVMRVLMALERVPLLSGALAWCGVSSLTILCVHRVESAIFNWQKIMEFFRPDVWGWGLTVQGFYQFGLRIALVLAASALLVHIVARMRAGESHAACRPSRMGELGVLLRRQW